MSFAITEQEKSILLSEARETIAAKLEKRQPLYKSDQFEGTLSIPCGAFVTLHTRAGRKLRGCIGRMAASTPLWKTVRVMALQAAFDDPRFPPLGLNELDQIEIEISALSPMEICEDPRSVKVGEHGLYLSHRGRSGVLLPQVPLEQGWNLDEYLDYICIKAGLPPHSYDAPGAELYTFTAVVFGEE